MESYPLQFKENTGFLAHIRMLFNLYWPTLKPSIIIFAIYPCVVYLLAAALKTGVETEAIVTLVNIAITMNLCLSPVMLTKRDFRDISTQLPVNALEKLGFLLLTFWVLVPAIIFISMFLGQVFARAFIGIYIPIDFLGISNGVDFFGGANYLLYSWIMIASIISVVLYYVVKTKKNRVLSAIVSFIIMFFLMIFIMSFCYAFFMRFHYFGEDPNRSLMAYYITEVIIGLIGVTYLIKLYRKLRYCGF